MKFRPFFSMLAFALLASPNGAYAAATRASPFIGKGQAMVPPRGFVAMCQRDSSACGPMTPEMAALPIDGEVTWQYHSATGAIGCDAKSTARRSEAPVAGLRSVKPIANMVPANTMFEDVAQTECPSSSSHRLSKLRQSPARAHNTTTVQDYELLKDVNRAVNGRVRQLTDRQIYGTDEYWIRSTLAKNAQGDCEDLALEKRHELVARGFDPSRLFLAVVYRSQVGLHTVLVARLADGDFVLDSRTPYVDRWTGTAYSWVVVQDAVNPNSWYKPERGVKVAAARITPLNP